MTKHLISKLLEGFSMVSSAKDDEYECRHGILRGLVVSVFA